MSIFDIGNGFGIIDNVVDAMEREAIIKERAAHCYRCTNCSKPTRVEMFFTGDEVPFAQDQVKILHDVSYDCKFKYPNLAINHACNRGDKNFDMRVCKTCHYGQANEVQYVEESGRHPVTNIKMLYKCTCKEHHYGHKGEFCTPLYSCDHYVSRDGEKNDGEEDGQQS